MDFLQFSKHLGNSIRNGWIFLLAVSLLHVPNSVLAGEWTVGCTPNCSLSFPLDSLIPPDGGYALFQISQDPREYNSWGVFIYSIGAFQMEQPPTIRIDKGKIYKLSHYMTNPPSQYLAMLPGNLETPIVKEMNSGQVMHIHVTFSRGKRKEAVISLERFSSSYQKMLRLERSRKR